MVGTKVMRQFNILSELSNLMMIHCMTSIAELITLVQLLHIVCQSIQRNFCLKT